MKIIKAKANILLLFLAIMFTSCKVYKLRNIDNQWQSYKKGDIVIFENSNGKLDTINVRESNTRNAKEINPYEFFPEKHQINSSTGELNNDEPTIVESKQILFKRNISLIYISRENDSACVGFSEYKAPAYFDIYIPINEMSIFSYKDELYGECFRIINVDNYRIDGSSGRLSSLIFSKKYGYLKFEFKDGSFIKLKEFIRDRKNIL